MIALYAICNFYLILMSAVVSNSIAKLIMLSGAVVGTISIIDNSIIYMYPIYVSLIYSLLLSFVKANSTKAFKWAVILRFISIIIFILSLILIF